jgi:DNA-binding NtrC family response regulator
MSADPAIALSAAPRARICLVEDDEIMGESLCDRFRLEGFETDWMRTATQGEDAIAGGSYSVVISDVRLPDRSGEILFERLRRRLPVLPPFIFITGYGSIDRAVSLLKSGAADYVSKPFELDELVSKVRALSLPVQGEASPIGAEYELGISAPMRNLAQMVPRIARHASAVLITGESGVGKERVAELIHRSSARERAPFVAVNCGALAESLLESELFGYERGAFTGATRSKRGMFELADGGTLLLDEVGDMPLSMQVKVLRAIQEQRVTRVGGETAIPVRFKLICATNRDLRKMVEEGRFREDLFFRVNVIHLRIPPLRERRDDILWFAKRFLMESAEKHGVARFMLSPEAESALIAHPWPGNLRELRHAVERACILSTSPVLEPRLFAEDGWSTSESAPAITSLSGYVAQCEREYIERALQDCDNQIGKAAAQLGISRKNLWEKLRKLGVRAVDRIA